jgi:hypothetical protein
VENLLGWLFLIIIFFFVFIWTIKYPHTKNFLLAAFLLRAICVILDNYNVIILPDSTADAVTFERKAREFSENYGLSIVFDIFQRDGLLIARIISFFYTLFGESKMMAQSISVALGTTSVYLVYYLSSIIWDERSANKAAWVSALFPSLILYSSITLREGYIVFFLLIALIGVAKFFRNQKIISFLEALVGFSALIFFHGAASIGVFVFFTYLFLKLMRVQFNKLQDFRINVFSILFIILLSIPVILFFNNKIPIPYIPNLFDFNAILFDANVGIKYLEAESEYPSWFLINNIYELIPTTIMKVIYFLYSPFIWDIKKTYHIIGFLDTIPYFILSFYLIKNIRAIWENPVTRIFLIMFIVYLVIHALGVGNFGTAIRHKSKFVVILIILVAPKIHKFILPAQKKTYNE